MTSRKQINLRLDDDLLVQIRRAAEADRRSINSWIIVQLEQALGERQEDTMEVEANANKAEKLEAALAELWSHLGDGDWVIVWDGEEYEVTHRAHPRADAAIIVVDAANDGQWGDDPDDAYASGEAWAADMMGSFGAELLARDEDVE